MTSFSLFRPFRRLTLGAVLAALCVCPPAAWADEWQDVSIQPASYAPGDSVPLDVAALLAAQTAPDTRQRNNINRRLVNTPPAPPRQDRPALKLAIEAARWRRFAEEHLQDGDVLFRLGRARTHLFMNFSKVTAEATASPYSHTAVFRWRAGVPEVVDITSSGMRAQTFAVWMREVDQNTFAVRRLRAPYRDRIPAVLAYLEEQETLRPGFDYKFAQNNGTFYCNELTETAFRSAGIRLSEAVPPVAFPGIDEVPIWAWLVEKIGNVPLTTPMYVAGNDDYGMFASPKLEPVYCSLTDPAPSTDGLVVAALSAPTVAPR